MKNFVFLFAILINTILTAQQQTYVPDDNFENYLETHDANGDEVSIGDSNSMGNGVANDDYVYTSRINTVTYLNIYDLNIADLTGIEDFTALAQLFCFDNQLTSLDISQNTALTQLDCMNNQLIDLTVNSGLIILNCGNNQLSTIDISANTNLTGLSCEHNQLTEVDVSQSTDLEILYCDHNQLSGLDITNNSAITQLDCSNNQLTTLDIRNGYNVNFNYFNAKFNPDLTCVFVDDAGYMSTNWSGAIDDTATYVETQAECDDLTGIDEGTLNTVRIFPNPFTDNITIQVPDDSLVKIIRIKNMQGQTLYRNSYTQQIDLSALPPGMYFLCIDNEQGSSVAYKLVKK